MKKGAAIYGAGGHSRVISSILNALNAPVIGFFDDFRKKPLEYIQEAPVLGCFSEILKFRENITSVYLAIGDNKERRKSYCFLEENDFFMPALVHPGAYVEAGAVIENGTVVCVGAVVGTEAIVGKGVIVNTGSSVDHEARIFDFSHIAPGAVIAGRSIVGPGSFVGINASVRDKVVLGEGVTVGAGAIILSDVPNHKTVVGVWH